MDFDDSFEYYIANYVRTRNLERVNRQSDDVHPIESFYVSYGKRFLDLLIGIPAFIITIPIDIIVGLLVLIDMGWPVLFIQERPGKNGKYFKMYKFRSMRHEYDKEGNRIPAKERLTKFGLLIRKFSLDELPNFWNIVKGDMSILGPRPLPANFDGRYSDRHFMRHAIAPGLECPRMLSREDFDTDYQHQLESDVWYVENCSFLTDCKMVGLFFKMVLDMRQRKKNSELVAFFAGYDDDNCAINLAEALERYPEIADSYNKDTDKEKASKKNTMRLQSNPVRSQISRNQTPSVVLSFQGVHLSDERMAGGQRR